MKTQKWHDEFTEHLCEAVLSLETVEDCYKFFEDVCTVGEVKAMAQRLMVAQMLFNGHTYDDIILRTGASTATISRVKRCLLYGADGYKMVLERLKKETERKKGEK